MTEIWNARLPPVAAILAAIERECAVSALAAEPVPTFEELAKSDIAKRALLQRLHEPKEHAQRPWRWGVAMVGGPTAYWEGVGNVVKRSWAGSSFCTVWRKLPLDKHPGMKQWKRHDVAIEILVDDILRGRIKDAYP